MALTGSKGILPILGLLLCCLVMACGQAPDGRYRVDESYTLGADDKRPWGGYIFHRFMQKAFSDVEPVMNKRSFEKWHNKDDNSYESDIVYILASPQVMALEEEAEAMNRFVRKGNTLLIASDALSDAFSTVFSIQLLESGDTSSFTSNLKMRDTYKWLRDSARRDTSRFGYFYYPFTNYLSASSRYSAVQVLGVNEYGKADFIRIRMGQGQLLLVTNAQALSNYFLLSQQNARYALNLISYLPAYPSNVVWDDFYRKNVYRQAEDQSIFSALLAIPPLAWAFWLILIVALLWVISNLRRKQRLIPVLAPNTNSSVEFTQTIARLYFNKKDNANVARKMTTYFFDHLRQRYYMQANINNDGLPALLSTKTGITLQDAAMLVQLMKEAQQSSHFSDESLLLLHAHIQALLKRH